MLSRSANARLKQVGYLLKLGSDSRCTQRRFSSTWQGLPRGPKLLAIGLIGAGTIGLSLGIYNYYGVPPSPYPEGVTKHIRKALYYEGAGSDPKSAIHYYLQALEEATTLGLDQTSDKMTGLKIKIGAVYENAGRLDSAIRVYSGLLNELKVALRDTKLDPSDRTRILRRALGTSIKVGDLSADYEPTSRLAEPAYVWALETMLRESSSRKDTDWLEPEARGGLLESIANFYYTRNQPSLALPLYLKALEVVGGSNCHTITIMNNVASSISSQDPSIQVQENSKEWAVKARDLKASDAVENQAECDLGRCSAYLNLGMIAEKSMKLEDAKHNFEVALKKAATLEQPEGREISKMATAGLDRLQTRHT